MSKEELARFSKDVEANEDLKKAVMEVGSDGDAIVKLAQSKGYDITKEDLEKVKGQLSDTDLDNVAGGAVGFKVIDV